MSGGKLTVESSPFELIASAIASAIYSGIATLFLNSPSLINQCALIGTVIQDRNDINYRRLPETVKLAHRTAKGFSE